MCGIAGIYQLGEKAGPEDLEIVTRMTDSLKHRGPDAWGVSRQGNAVLGNRRLAIQDCSPAGNQPMSDVAGSVWVTFNGEIYNAPELRRQLQGKGRSFRSSSDTEVLVQGYLEWGIEHLLRRLRGMFAFALVDQSDSSRQFVLARDRIGIKPLYYYFCQGRSLFFASELRGLLASGQVPRNPDRSSFLEYLQWGTIQEPQTAIQGVCCLLPGHYLTVKEQAVSSRSYWNLSDRLGPIEGSQPDRKTVVSELRESLQECVECHLLSDVPVGVFLSGGIDSSSIAILAAAAREDPLRTISVSFDESEFSEGEIAHQVAHQISSQHTDVRVSGHDFLTQMTEVLQALDQPTIDGVNTYYVSWAARNCGLKVVLSGAGGDELFLGYPHFHAAARGQRLSNLLAALPLWLRRALTSGMEWGGGFTSHQGIDRISYLNQPGVDAFYKLYRGLFGVREIQSLADASESEMKNLLGREGDSGNMSFLRHLIAREFSGYLLNQLLRDTDVMSMANAVEVRVPLLDHLLVEKVASWPDSYKFQAGVNKPLLVDAMKPDLPRVVWDRPKQGFVFPLAKWLRQHHESLRDQAGRSDWLAQKAVQEIWDRFLKGRIHWSRPWATLVWTHWEERVL